MPQYKTFLLTIFLVLPTLCKDESQLRVLMTHGRFFHRYNKSELRYCRKDPRYPLKTMWQYEQAAYLVSQKSEVQPIFLICEELQIPDIPLLGEWTEFDPSPELPILCYEGKPVEGVPRVLQEKVAMTNYEEFMCKKFNWSHDTWRSIDWEGFKTALWSRSGHLVSLRKCIHGWLPVAQLVQNYGPDKITHCPDCHGRECQDHVLRCPSPVEKHYGNGAGIS